ncbi:MAG: thiamine-phosphate kinase [Planctomycetes bacterium]|nr:thiamine-phosphate kinase [Planctomycetota bacterium]
MGEIALIKYLRRLFKSSKKGVVVGIGDDCAIVRIGKRGTCLITTDMLIEGTHFILKECTPKQIGRKAIGRCISDIAAMGCKATFAVVSVGFGRNTTMEFAREIHHGIKDVAGEYDIEIVGGDITTCRGVLFAKANLPQARQYAPTIVSVTMLGEEAGAPPVLRSGANAGDAIMVTGTLGGSILGKHLTFKPRLKEGIILNTRFKLHSMIDISDGLSTDLCHILEESGVGAVLYEESIPISEDAKKLSKKTGKPPLLHALSDGEDYELLFTLSQGEARKLLANKGGVTQPLHDIKITQIGHIRKGEGLVMKYANGKAKRIKPTGYEHLLF